LDGWKTQQRYIIERVLIPEYQKGRTAFDGWEDAERLVYTNFSSESSTEEKQHWGTTLKKRGWGKKTDILGLSEAQLLELLEQAALHPERHAMQHAPRGRPRNEPPQYKMNWGAAKYPAWEKGEMSASTYGKGLEATKWWLDQQMQAEGGRANEVGCGT
jgi:hypothetical protein